MYKSTFFKIALINNKHITFKRFWFSLVVDVCATFTLKHTATQRCICISSVYMLLNYPKLLSSLNCQFSISQSQVKYSNHTPKMLTYYLKKFFSFLFYFILNTGMVSNLFSTYND